MRKNVNTYRLLFLDNEFEKFVFIKHINIYQASNARYNAQGTINKYITTFSNFGCTSCAHFFIPALYCLN